MKFDGYPDYGKDIVAEKSDKLADHALYSAETIEMSRMPTHYANQGRITACGFLSPLPHRYQV